jgi:hypothetical protein
MKRIPKILSRGLAMLSLLGLLPNAHATIEENQDIISGESDTQNELDLGSRQEIINSLLDCDVCYDENCETNCIDFNSLNADVIYDSKGQIERSEPRNIWTISR